ncbi:MAG: Na(+)/H(+) antiporter subunit D [Pseudomonadota bacterium]
MIEVLAMPGLWLIAAGLLLPFCPVPIRRALILAVPLAALMGIWSLPDGASVQGQSLGMDLIPVQADALGRLFATVFAFMAFAGGLFALNQRNTIELSAAFVYAGSAVGVCFAGDLITVFIFWEIMAIGSTTVVWMGGGKAEKPGIRYAVIHFFGGVMFMAGIAGVIGATGSTAFTAENIAAAPTVAYWLILSSFLLNAGSPPLSPWLPDAYPAASWSGTVFLSAFTTKTAVFTMIRGFPGEEILIYVGISMVIYGIVYAILENDMRRILSFSIINQVGYMVCAVGIGTELALNGAAAHAFAHIIYKALLLMSAGSVLYMTGKSKCSDLGGLFRTMPVSCICGIIGGLAIAGMPLTSGFVSKTMISSAAAEEHMFWVWIALGVGSAGVFLHATIKYPWFVFFQKDSGLRPKDPPWNMQAAMILMAVICIALGIWYTPLHAALPYAIEYPPYKTYKIVFYLQLLGFSGLAFFLLLPLLKRTLTITLDVDWFWRRGGIVLAREFQVGWLKGWSVLADGWLGACGRAARTLYRHHGPTGTLARTQPSGSMALWMAVLLLGFLVFSFV